MLIAPWMMANSKSDCRRRLCPRAVTMAAMPIRATIGTPPA